TADAHARRPAARGRAACGGAGARARPGGGPGDLPPLLRADRAALDEAVVAAEARHDVGGQSRPRRRSPERRQPPREAPTLARGPSAHDPDRPTARAHPPPRPAPPAATRSAASARAVLAPRARRA